ncbi:phosphomannomutase [Bernardetia litoralis DSM 6794]|uniref:Phosphomannomutase n=1 Tax=Bernardetia litoralis (strain ATCC 23117 / DSM 6794 / NBRC 15988 / NCIMB 1366 / Fx l1 / Sio-4) TaxID=880071 RepID=I4AJB6_BERLS|nr:phospho-sugar mutase [Bernardetia litoralis]AFM04051.1 phosphomannomutase [Bernardetia litoralis DSM 6794]
MLESTIQQKVNHWLNGNYDNETKEAIKKLSETDLTDAFYKNLEFGTGGLRGLMGVGTNRMNRYTVGAATQGLSNYLKKSFPTKKEGDISVAIAYDSRNNSPEFAQIVADIFSANGIKVFLFTALRPTPELSFAIRYLGCKSGVVLTASHNPKEYNGYKAYWEDGGQVVAPHDKNIITEVQAIKNVDEIKFEGKSDLIKNIGVEIDKEYLHQILEPLVDKKTREIVERQKDLSIVYTPIHGTGITLVPKALRKLRFENIHVVEEQALADGNFPTVVYPNPEEAEAMTLALKKAKEVNADVVMATDPDADRVGIAVKNKESEFVLLNGNQTLALLVAYNLEAWKNADKLNGNQMVIKTIVTTELIKEITQKYSVNIYDTLTGFKHIAALIESKKQSNPNEEFILGGEESYGYLIGDEVRDKDGVASCASIALLAAFAKDKGFSLFEWLIEIYKEYGFYLEELVSITKKGQQGAAQIEEMMKTFRQNPPKKLAGNDLLSVYDYQNQTILDVQKGISKPMEADLPKSNVLAFYTEDGSKISMRPSGTEPKIKFYFSVKDKLDKTENYEKVKKGLQEKIQKQIADLGIN